MTKNDVKREILQHANMLGEAEAMTAEQSELSIHQTVGAAFSAIPETQRAWIACQIGYALARCLDDALEQP